MHFSSSAKIVPIKVSPAPTVSTSELTVIAAISNVLTAVRTVAPFSPLVRMTMLAFVFLYKSSNASFSDTSGIIYSKSLSDNFTAHSQEYHSNVTMNVTNKHSNTGTRTREGGT